MKLNSKVILISAIAMSASQAAIAVVTSGIGMAYRGDSSDKPIYTHSFFIEETIPGEKINEQWCVSQIVDDIKCDSFSRMSFLDPWQDNTLCTLGVKLSPVLTSTEGERVLGNDFVESYKSYVIWAKEDNDDLNILVDQIPFRALRLPLNSGANLLSVTQHLDELISSVKNKPSAAMISSIKTELVRHSCSNVDLSDRFTQKKTLEKSYLAVQPSCKGSYNQRRASNPGDNYIACGLATFSETFKNVTFPVDPKTGKINILATPINSSEEITTKSVERFCTRGNHVGDAEFNCKEEGRRLQTLIDIQK